MVENQQGLVRYSRPESSLSWPAAITTRTVDPRQLSINDIWHTLAKRKSLILNFAAFVLCAALAYILFKTPMYEGVARLHIDPTRSTSLGLDADDDKDRPTSTDVEGRIKTEVAIIQSDTVALQVMKSLQLYADPHFAGKYAIRAPINSLAELTPTQRRRFLERFEDNLTVKTIPATQIVEISFRSSDPVLATNVANSIIDEYLQRNLAARVQGTAQVSQWVLEQMQEIRSNTTAAQNKLAAFQKDNDMLGTDESDNIVTDRLKQLNEELTQAEADRIVKEGRYRLASPSNAELINSLVPNTSLQVLRTQEADLRTQYAQLSSKFGSGYPKLHEIQDELSQVQTAITAEGENVKTRLGNEYSAAAKSESLIRNDFEQQKAEAFKLNEHVSQYAILKHEVEAGQQLYDTLQLKLKAAGITSGLASSFVDVIDRAQVPDKPVEPRKVLDLALGLAGGLLGGVLLGLVRDSFDDTIRNSQEMEAVAALPELVSVPFLPALAKKRGPERKETGPFFPSAPAFSPIAFREPDSPGIEAYRALCSAILQTNSQNSTKVLVITSATPGEGKSTVSCNLATALAQRGRKVLLVDADLRSTSIRSHLGLARSSLTAMCGALGVEHPRYQPVPSLPGLNLLPAGIRPDDPTGVLDSARMQELLAAWREEYDNIIIDTPPVLLFADALVLAAQADNSILVTRSGVSRSKSVLLARDLLARSGARILGFVLNAVRHPDYYYGYPETYGPQYGNPKSESGSEARAKRGGL
jgi:capsular exopolysaccharide synthesis family protein